MAGKAYPICIRFHVLLLFMRQFLIAHAYKGIISMAPVKKSATDDQGPDPIDIHVGARLRLRRNLIGFSQDQLGKALGLTFQQIQKYERGTNRMGASRLFQVARLLKVPVTYFFEDLPAAVLGTVQPGFGEAKQAALEGVPGEDEQVFQRRETLELIRAYYRIADPKHRRKVYELIKTMAVEGKE
jgi:transcriptional regulator with XRE-family HTH domain